MSLSILCQNQSQIARLLGAVLFCLGYFNFSLIAEPVSIFFQISSFTGKVIISKFSIIFNCILELTRLTFVFFQVLYEDSLIFIKDAKDKLAFFIFILQQLYLFLENFGWKVIKGFLQLGEVICSIVAFFYYTLVTVKEGVQFLGLTIWRCTTNAPEVFILKVNGFFELLSNTCDDFKKFVFEFLQQTFDSLEKSYLFIVDFPPDSVYGLIIGLLLLIILCVKFKSICIIVTRGILKLYKKFISFGGFLWSGKFLEQKSRRIESFDDNDILCIVCQVKLKEIIIFPCKHLCLCGDCSLQLVNNHPLCPLCRSDITGTMKVYL